MSGSAEPRWRGASEASAAIAARYEDLAARAAAAELRFDRAFRTRLCALDDGWISLTELDDDFHSMRIALRIAADGTVTEAVGRMLRHPFDTCPRALEAVSGLVGTNVARPAAHRQVKERLPRDEACLHVADMATIAYRAFRISKGHDIDGGYTGEEARRRFLDLMPTIRDTCVSFAVSHQGEEP